MQQYRPLHHPINYSLSTTPRAAVDMIHMLRKISGEPGNRAERRKKEGGKNNLASVVLEPRCQSFCPNPGPHQGYLGVFWDCGRKTDFYEHYREKVGMRDAPALSTTPSPEMAS